MPDVMTNREKLARMKPLVPDQAEPGFQYWGLRKFSAPVRRSPLPVWNHLALNAIR